MRNEEFYHYCYFKQPSPWAETCLLVSDTMGYTAEPEFRIERSSFHNHLAFYVKKGIFYLKQYGKEYVLKQGDFGILDLNDAHVYYSDPVEVAHLLWFHFRGAGTENMMEALRQNHTLPLLYHNPVRELDFLELFRLTRAGCDELELSGRLYGILMKCLQDSPVAVSKTSNIPKELQNVILYMEAHMEHSLTLDELSRKAGMEKYHFCHMFKKWYGISPIQYYTEKKMEYACRLLQNKDASTDEIAEKLGYLDTGYFRKVFRNHFGITPAAYRKYIG